MSTARLDLERLFNHSKREIEKILETRIRELLIEKYGGVKGGVKFTEIASMISDTLLVDPTRYRNIREYISALKVYTLGSVFLAKAMDVLSGDKEFEKILDFLNKAIRAISISAPDGNILLLYNELSRLIEKELDLETANRILLAAIFEYMNTVLKAISIKALSQPERELLSKSIVSIIKSYKTHLVPLELIYRSFNIPISYKDFVKLITEISEASTEVILFDVRGKKWATTKEKLEMVINDVKSLAKSLGEIDAKTVSMRLPDIPRELIPIIFKRINALDKDYIVKRKPKLFGKLVLVHYPHEPEAFAARILEEGIQEFRKLKETLKR